MKIVLILSCLIVGTPLMTWSQQPPPPQNNRLNAYRIASFSQNLDLSPKEAEVFWPLYNEYEKKRKKLRPKRVQQPDWDQLSDDEIRKLINDHLQKEQAMLDLRKSYIRQLMEVLPVRKVAMLPSAEREFKRKLLHELKKRRHRQN